MRGEVIGRVVPETQATPERGVADESLRFVDDPATLRLAGVAAGFAAIAFVAGTFKTRWDGET